MTIQLNGIEFDFPETVQVQISEDGKKVKVYTTQQATEKSVEVVERVVERIRIVEVEVEKPCTKMHYYQSPYTTFTPQNPYYTTLISKSGTNNEFDTSKSPLGTISTGIFKLVDGGSITCGTITGTNLNFS